MFLKTLKLTNFRNYDKFDLTFDPRHTIFIGPNGAGKSNILEAIYMLATTKSPRVEFEIELINNQNNFLNVSGKVMNEGETDLLVSVVSNGDFRKKVTVNGVGRRIVDFIGHLPAVIFWPSDINMVTGPPSLRRWHLDVSLAQIDRDYRRALTGYGEILVSRNRVLKRIREGLAKLDELDFWTKELVKEGKVVSIKRKQFFEFINNLNTPLGDFQYNFKPSEISLEKLMETTSREVAAATTLIGPHRDNFEFQIRNSKFEIRNLSKYGSRGEQRMATLAFKLATLEHMESILGKRPILLLDDVFSELDKEHRAQVAQIAKLQQTIIATVELENIPQDFLDSSRILRVTNGKIQTSS